MMTRRDLLSSLSSLPVLASLPMLGSLRGVALAQGGGDRKSPHETVSVDLGGKKVEIIYGRPYLKGRQLADLAPNGEVWRLGADEATKLVLSANAKLNGTLSVPAGEYSLFAIPGASEWTVIVNKTANQWGAFKYDKAQDLGRFQVPVKSGASTEQFTIKLTKSAANTASVQMAWGATAVSFPIQLS